MKVYIYIYIYNHVAPDWRLFFSSVLLFISLYSHVLLLLYYCLLHCNNSPLLLLWRLSSLSGFLVSSVLFQRWTCSWCDVAGCLKCPGPWSCLAELRTGRGRAVDLSSCASDDHRHHHDALVKTEGAHLLISSDLFQPVPPRNWPDDSHVKGSQEDLLAFHCAFVSSFLCS